VKPVPSWRRERGPLLRPPECIAREKIAVKHLHGTATSRSLCRLPLARNLTPCRQIGQTCKAGRPDQCQIRLGFISHFHDAYGAVQPGPGLRGKLMGAVMRQQSRILASSRVAMEPPCPCMLAAWPGPGIPPSSSVRIEKHGLHAFMCAHSC
jgi:hypothetical protein